MAVKAPEARGGFEFDGILPRLVTAYAAGRLAPFTGVGMSRPHCADWPGLIRGLESASQVDGLPPLTPDTKPEMLIQRANRAVRMLRSRSASEFEAALREALFVRRDSVPEQTVALARIWWPLVVSTNYDNFYVQAFAREFGPRGLAVVGRGSEDCQRVLTSFTTAGRSLLWAIQGHLGAPWAVSEHEDDRRLSSELVIDHAEYRRVTYREPHFRRAFAEVFRHRSFLFLGSGLRESYLQELFGEVLELYGPSTHTHFAILPRGDVDPQFMYSRFQIAVVEYERTPEHNEVPNYLAQLRVALEDAQAAPTSWSWGRAVARGDPGQEGRTDFEVVRGPLPRKWVEGECLCVSAGGKLASDYFHVSDEIKPTLIDWCNEPPQSKPPPLSSPRMLSKWVGEYEGKHAFAVRARRENDDTKDLSQVRRAALKLFEAATPRHACLHMQLLASGGKDNVKDPTQPRHSIRVFPARFAFVEMVRAWGEWRRAHRTSGCRLVLHIVDPSVYREIQSGRIDVLELLLCVDLRFAAEIIDGGVLVERRQFKKHEETPLDEIVSELNLSAPHWTFEVSPLTGIDETAGRKPVMDYGARCIRDLGVVPGSTLHFRRRLLDEHGEPPDVDVFPPGAR
jgi:hypothetical protein